MTGKDPVIESNWDALSLIKRLLNEIYNQVLKGKSEDQVIENYASLIKGNKNLSRYIYDKMNVFGGAFAVVDNIERKVILLETSKFTEGLYPDKKIFIDIPYKELGEKRGDFIDFLFIERRRKQELKIEGTDELTEKKSYEFPEFIYHLKSFRGEEPFYSKQLKLGFKENFGDEFYCSAGEVLFFIYTWRWLIRYSQKLKKEELTAPIDFETIDIDNIFKLPNRRNIWNDCFLDCRMDIELPEITLLERIKKTTENDVKKCENDFLDNVLMTWMNIKDKENNADFLWDLENLGLRDPRVQSKLVLYAKHIAMRISVENKKLEKVSANLKNGKKVHLKDLNYALFCTFYKLLMKARKDKKHEKSNEGEKFNVFSLIKILHNLARFPLIPYFYMAVLSDSEDTINRSKEHFIFPVYNSYEFPIKYNAWGKIIKIPEVVFCLLSLKPHDKITTEVYENETKPEMKFWEDINAIKQVFNLLSQPIIDKIFYGTYRRSDWEQQSKERAVLDMERNKERAIAHLLKSLHAKLITFMKSKYEEDKKAAITISSFLSFYFSMRQFYSFEEPKEVHPVNFIDFLESLIIHTYVIHNQNMEQEHFDKFDIVLKKIEEYAFTFNKDREDIDSTDFDKFLYDSNLRKDILEVWDCPGVDFENSGEISVHINLSNKKETFYPLLSNFTELILNAFKNELDFFCMHLYVFNKKPNYILIFSVHDIKERINPYFFKRFKEVKKFLEEENKSNRFGLSGIEFFFKRRKCEFRVYKDEAGKFFSMLEVTEGSGLFSFQTIGEER